VLTLHSLLQSRVVSYYSYAKFPETPPVQSAVHIGQLKMQLSAILLAPLISFATLARAIPQPPRPANTRVPHGASESDVGAFQDCVSDSIGFHSCRSNSPGTDSQPTLMGIEDRLPHTTSYMELLMSPDHGEDRLSPAHRPSSPPPGKSAAQRHQLPPNQSPSHPAAATAPQAEPQAPPGLASSESYQRKPPRPPLSGKKPLRSQSFDNKPQSFKSPRKTPPRRAPFEKRASTLPASRRRAERGIWGD